MAAVAVLVAAHLWIAPATCPAQQKSNRIVEMLRRLDRNGDGQVDPNEVPGPIQPIVARIVERMKLDASRPIAIEAVERSLSGASGSPSSSTDKEKSDFKNSSPGGSGADSPRVPGFGVPDERKPVAGFDVPLNYIPPEERFPSNVIRYVDQIMQRYDRDRNDVLDAEEMKTVRWRGDPKSSDLNGDGQLSKIEMYERVAKRWSSQRSGGGSSSKTSTTSGNTDASARNREYAKSYLRQYDANKNGVLDREEWGKMKGDPEKDDLNKDGHLTVDEIVVRLENYSKKSNSTSGSSSTYSSPRKSSSGTSYIGRRPADRDANYYRALSPIERLPRGLPDWFARNDANTDGQISMSEFATTWNEAKAAEFASYDLNRDGVITPAEYLEAKKSADKK